jgi:large repetitive protein
MAGGNTVTVFGSGFTSSAITGVTVGGVAATNVVVRSADKLTMTVPAFTSGTTTCQAGDDQVNDVCQSQVVVSNANGPSATSTIEPPQTGVPFEGISGGTALPACLSGNTCEIVAAVTEYDYLVTPVITSVTTTSAGDPTTWASEQGTTIATIDGKGFDPLGMPWINIGDPTVASNQDFDIVTITPTELQVILNPHNPTREPVKHQFTVQSLAGLSHKASIEYAGVPVVKRISPAAVSDSGGSHVAIKGNGFQGISNADGGEISYEYVLEPASTDQHGGYTATSVTSITAHTPQSNPGVFIVSVCTVTACSEPRSQANFDHSLIDFFQPGKPVVTSVSAKSGPASGGTRLIIRGKNLSDAIAVQFGKTPAREHNSFELLTNGSSTMVIAVAPPGKAGTTKNIRVTTAESKTGGTRSAKTTAATFHYTTSVASPVRDVVGKAHGSSLHVSWLPPVSNGGRTITGYRVSAIAFPVGRNPHAKRAPSVHLLTASGARTATLTGLRYGWYYRIEVQAVNGEGRGRPGNSRRAFLIRQPA